MRHCLTLFGGDMQPTLRGAPDILRGTVAGFSGSIVPPLQPGMKSPPTSTLPPATADKWPARLAHELICAVVAGIFCVFEALIQLTEWWSKLFSRRP
jgi:hypothetical protein